MPPDILVKERPVEAPPVVEEPEPVVEAPPVVEEAEPVVIEKPRLRDGLAKARTAFTGAFVSVRSRSAIDDETWDELEEALIRADVGVGVTTELLDDLRPRVKAKEITEPDAAARRAARPR